MYQSSNIFFKKTVISPIENANEIAANSFSESILILLRVNWSSLEIILRKTACQHMLETAWCTLWKRRVTMHLQLHPPPCGGGGLGANYRKMLLLLRNLFTAGADSAGFCYGPLGSLPWAAWCKERCKNVCTLKDFFFVCFIFSINVFEVKIPPFI